MSFVHIFIQPFWARLLVCLYSLRHKKYWDSEAIYPADVIKSHTYVQSILQQHSFASTNLLLLLGLPFAKYHVKVYTSPLLGKFGCLHRLAGCSAEAFLRTIVVAVRYTELCCCSCRASRLALLFLSTILPSNLVNPKQQHILSIIPSRHELGNIKASLSLSCIALIPALHYIRLQFVIICLAACCW